MKPIPTPSVQQVGYFWSMIDRLGPDDCWEWQAGRTSAGYGLFTISKGVRRYAHRIAYFLTTGIQPTLYVRHSCDNPACCNPNHLSEGTQQQNMDDKVAHDRQHKGETSPGSILTEEQVKQIRSSHATDCVLGERFNVSPKTVASARRGDSWKHLSGAEKREPTRKLTEEQVEHIRKTKDRGCDLAARFDVSQQLICAIRKGRRYVT